MKQAFESGEPASPKLAKHLDRCLSCLSCMTTCPAGVDYMHLVDHGRAYVEATLTRSFYDRAVRWTLAKAQDTPTGIRDLGPGEDTSIPMSQA